MSDRRLCHGRGSLRNAILTLVRRVAGVEQVRGRLDDVEHRLALLDAALWTPPYLAEGQSLSVRGPDGRPTLGYEGAGQTERGYRGFEDLFRGEETFIRARQQTYVDILRPHEVLDLGCGRGELLDLLAEEQIDAKGVDTDAGMVERCRSKGHNVTQDDALSYLAACEPASVGAIFSAQFVEHLSYPMLLRIIAEAYRVLRPGGLFVTETVNPHSIPALRTFWVDLSHEKPIFPEVLLALCRDQMFASSYVLFPNGRGDLSDDLRHSGEYAVVARR